MDFQFRPIIAWPGLRTAQPMRAHFSANWSTTLDLLDRELHHLKAKRVVIQADVGEDQIRLDGMLYANARPRTPGVILSFESKHGPLSYPCDRFNNWQDNVRAIALSLYALRSVDRYGVTRRAEQYRGWQQLPAPDGAIGMGAGGAGNVVANILTERGSPCDWTELMVAEGAGKRLREAEVLTHPDRGGDPALFKQVQRAREALEKHFGKRI